MHQASSFITLTYDDDHLPEDYSVHRRPLQLFLKRLRKDLAGKIRFYGCGEYGELDRRPHFHALIFGWDFHADRKFWKKTDQGTLFTSAQLQKLWPNGFSTVGAVTYQSAGYCAGYLKARCDDGDAFATNRYTVTHPVTKAICRQREEFGAMSNKPGIGSTWFDKYQADVFPSDFIVVDEHQIQVPRYYQLKLNEREQQLLKHNRGVKRLGKDLASNKTKERLAVRETVRKSQLSQLKRTL